jgi:hypothetical protein
MVVTTLSPAALYIYSNIDGALLERDFPVVGKAAKLIREKLAFPGNIEVKRLGKNRAGEYSHRMGTIRFAEYVAQREWTYVIEIAVHEAIHALGVRHQDNFRSHGGKRCGHGRDTLSCAITQIVTGRITFAEMKRLHKISAHMYPKKLLRQIAMIETIIRAKYHINDTLGIGDVTELADARSYRWQQMSPEQRRLQVNKMKVGRMKSLGWDFKVSACHSAPASYNGRSYTYQCDECYMECDVRDA